MIIIKNIDVYSPDYIGKKDIFISGGKINLIRDNIDINHEDIKVIDGSNKILTPGFIDQHVHITGGGGEGSFKTRAPEITLSKLTTSGITTVVGLLGTDGTTRSVEIGMLNLVAKAKALKEEGISVYAHTGSYEYPTITLTGSVKKDIVFIEEIIGAKTAISDHRSSSMTNTQLAQLASDVRVAGMMSGKAGILVIHMGNGEKGLNPVFEVLKETEIHISINEAVKNDLEIIYEEIGTLKNEKLTLTKNIESLKNALKSLGIDEIEKELDRLSNIISTYPHSISLLIESKAKREANIKNYIDRLNELEINLNTKNKELNFYKENFRYELNLGYIEELKALEECEAIEYVIEKYKLSESYKQNDIISNIHEIIRESSLELNNYNIGVYDTDNIYTNYEDENIKGLIEISKRVDIRIKLQKKEISLYDLIKKLNLNIEEDNIDKHTMIKYDYKNFIVKFPYTKHIYNIKHTIYYSINKSIPLLANLIHIYEDDNIYVGKVAKERKILYPNMTAEVFKRSMGTDKEFVLGDKKFKAEELSSFVLKSLKEDAEVKLNAGFKEIKAQVEGFLANKEYNKALDAFASIKPLVDNLFDNVMIMDKDEAVKANRLGLLKQIYDTMLTICDLSKIVYK